MKICPRCNKKNTADSLYCNCGMVLDQKEAVNLELMREKANSFTSKLMQEPLGQFDASKGLMETMFQNVLRDPKKVEELRQIIDGE